MQTKADVKSKLMQNFLPNLDDEVKSKLKVVFDKQVKAIISFNKASQWLPLFEAGMCDGTYASSEDIGFISELFCAPVLTFSVFDSDVLFVSYSDKANQVSYDYAKPNIAEFEEYDTKTYNLSFPKFLLDFCNESEHEKLKDIWESTDYIFAEDRMRDICQLIQTPDMYWLDNIPDGYKAISAE